MRGFYFNIMNTAVSVIVKNCIEREIMISFEYVQIGKWQRSYQYEQLALEFVNHFDL